MIIEKNGYFSFVALNVTNVFGVAFDCLEYVKLRFEVFLAFYILLYFQIY